MKKSVIISILFILTFNNQLFSAQPSAQQLLTEFNRVSNPLSPEYNERRTKEILTAMEKVAPTRVPQLEVSYLRPLNARLEQAVATAQATEGRLNQEITRLQAAQRQAEQQFRHSEELLRRQTTAMQQQQSEATAREARLQQSINDVQADYRAAQDTIAQQIAQSNANQRALAQLQQDIATIQGALQNTRNQLAQEQQQNLNTQALLRNQLDQTARETHVLQANLNAAQQALQQTQANHAQELTQMQQQLAQTITQQQTFEQERNQLQAQYLTAQQNLADQQARAKTTDQAHQTELTALQQQLTQAGNQLTTLESELEQLRATQTTSQQAFADQAAALELEQRQKRTALTQYGEQRSELEAQIVAATQENTNLRSQLQALEASKTTELGQLQGQLRNTQSELAQALAAASRPIAALPVQTEQIQLAAKDAHIAQLTQQVEQLTQEIRALKAQPRITPATTALHTMLTAPSSSNTEIENRIKRHPLFSTFSLTQGIPRTITMADNKKYFLENPDQPIVAENLAKYTQAFPVEKPTPSAGIDIALSASPADIEAAQKAAEEQAQAEKTALSPEELGNKQIEELKQLSAPIVSTSAEASLADLGSSTFEMMSDLGGLGGIKEEGSCGDEYAQNGTLALYVVHGTWSDNEAFAGNINTLASYNIFKFACQLAYAEKMKVQVISLSWSGSLDYYDREQVAIGQLAADFDRRIDQNKADKIWVIAHSHGCNISARAANHMYDKFNRLVDVGVFLACPTLDIPRNMDFKTLYAFYSQGDFTQMAGSVQTGISRYTINTDRKVPFAAPGSGRKVYNIRTQMDGLDMDHISIKWGVLPYLAKVLSIIDTYFSCYYDLDLNVKNNEPNALPLISIRDENKNCETHDPIAIAKSKEAKIAFRQKYGRDMSSIGRFYITGATWLTNLAREATTGIKAWWKGGEPRIAAAYLTEIPASPSSSSRSSSPQSSSSSQ